MLRRVRKITSLLIAAASIISIIPSGVSASTEKIKVKDGEIYNAIAYKDGKTYIQGEPQDKDEAAYYLNNGKYSEFDDIDSEDEAEIYGTKYLEINDGDYYVDLSNGDVSNDSIKDDEIDDAEISLRSEIKSDNDGRFDEDDGKEVKDLTELPNCKFAEPWYEAEYNVEDSDDTINGGAETINVYTDGNGNYIDADYNLGKVKIKLSNRKAVTIENTNEEDDDVRVQVTPDKVVGQDSSNIYRLATITVKSSDSETTIEEVNGVDVEDDATVFSVSDSGLTVSFNVIQVISKSQSSGDVDGIKYAKNVYNYMISDKDGSQISLLGNDNFTVADGKLINYIVDDDSIEAEVINLEDSGSTYYIDLGDYDHVKLEDGEDSVDVDAEGNLWAVSDDAVYEFDNDEDFQKIYTTGDDEYNNISVYDKENLIVWNQDDEIYSIISNATSESSDEDDSSTSTAADETTSSSTSQNTAQVVKGWVNNSNGKWSYNNADGTKFKGWLSIDGFWYYMNNNGIMVTGWNYINGNWYFSDNSGVMKTGWINDNGTWYYLNSSGTMLSNTTIDGYKLGSNGAWIK